ncbi:MAG: amino acid ABC transporter permease [Oscillospiraceae bacterium]|jgi:polar amino acid transport system permease protein|nr:amino acid ABC transporter permease [Oscillospiraceae bacterium]
MVFWEITGSLLRGFQTTFYIFALTLLFALPLGLLVSFGSMSKFAPLRYVVRVIVWIVRGIPLMLQIFIIFYVPGFIFGQPIASRFNTAIIAFSINYACYFSEIYRGGIESISHSQYEAGQVLGMTKSQIFLRVVLLQVIKRIAPPMSNEVITLVKDTALARVIIVVEILKVAENFVNSKALIWPLFYTGVFYLLFVGMLTLLFGYIEKRLSYFKA